MSDRITGTVKWFNGRKGFGFIQEPANENKDIFVHFRAIRGDGYRTLKDGQQVEFGLLETDKGLQAEDVVVVELS